MKYEIGGSGGDVEGLRRLLDRPNADHTMADSYSRLTADMRECGGGFIWVVPDARGIPLEMYHIPVAEATIHVPDADYPEGHYRIWLSSRDRHANVVIEPEWMMYPRCPDPAASDAEIADRVSAALTKHVARRFGENLTVTVLPS